MPMLPIGLGVAGAAAGGGGFASILGAIVPLIGALAGGGGGGQSAPAAPAPAPAPEAPDTSTAADVGEEPIVDTEAARVRAQQRRAASLEDDTLTGLSESSKTAVNLTNSLLGE